MFLPEKIAESFIKLIDLEYLKFYPYSEQPEEYLSFVEDYMSHAFRISWSLGGTYGTCWDNEITESKGDSEPDMNVLNKFLTTYFSHLTEKQLHKIYQKIDYKETSESDWYGGSTSEATKNLYFEPLAEVLMETMDITDCTWIDFENLIEEHSLLVPYLYPNTYDKIYLNKTLRESLEVSDSPHKKNKV